MQQLNIDVSVARPANAGLLAQLGRETFVEAFENRICADNLLAFADKRYGLKQQSVELADPGTIFFIAMHRGEAIGYAKLCQSVAPAVVAAERSIELERLYLYAQWYGRGVAHRLMAACYAEAAQRACEGIWLDVWDQNHRARGFYRKYGFELVGERSYVVGRETQRHLLMYRDLDDALAGR